MASPGNAAPHRGSGGDDVIFIPLTDAMELYASRMQEMRERHGAYDAQMADEHYAGYLQSIDTQHMRALDRNAQKQLHNFKYFTWVEQQGKTSDELRRLWDDDFWAEVFSQDVVNKWDRLIEAFNG